MQDVRAHIESVVSAVMGKLRLSVIGHLSSCAKEACVRDEADVLKELLAGVETRFREEHTALVETINTHTAATMAQTSLLVAVCLEVKAMSEKIGVLCSHTVRLVNIESDIVAIAKSVQGVANGTDVVSSFVTRLNEHHDDFRLVFEHNASDIRKVERQ